MNPKKTAVFAASMLLLGACSASTGIVDNFAPPQQQTQSQSRSADCAAVQTPPQTPGTPAVTTEPPLVPCVVESVAALAKGQIRDRQRDASRPGRVTPPRFPRFRH